MQIKYTVEEILRVGGSDIFKERKKVVVFLVAGRN